MKAMNLVNDKGDGSDYSKKGKSGLRTYSGAWFTAGV